MQEIEIAISPNGEVQLQVKGVAGDACLDLTKGLEASLGTVGERELTGDYYQQPLDQQNQQWNQGGS